MPTLNWLGKDKVVNHHNDVPFRILEHRYAYGEPSENMIIHGDNLDALKALLPQYEGKIKCIYIDPPYNTGNENWVYNDNVNDPKIKKWLGEVVGKEGEDLSRHDKWLCMMYPRLRLLQRLLADDGAIFISIDDNEQANLKLICGEIFGGGNFVAQFVWRRTDNQPNIGLTAKVKEYIICYAGNINLLSLGKLPLTEKAVKEYRYEDENGKFRRAILLDKTRGRYKYQVTTKSGNILTGPWMITEENFNELNNKSGIYWTSGGDEQPYGKIYLNNSEGQISNDFWGIEYGTNQRASLDLEELFEKRIFDFPKPVSLIETILTVGNSKDSIILDSFAGSGTTAHAVLNLNKSDGGNRRFILVEMEDYAENITSERVKRVIDGYADKGGTGGGFSFCELGEPLLYSDGNLNENVSEEKIKEYVWYTETKTAYNQQETPYYLGEKSNTAYYFYYERGEVTTLDINFLNAVKIKAARYIIYADMCALSDEDLTRFSIIFKKIPRDISRV